VRRQSAAATALWISPGEWGYLLLAIRHPQHPKRRLRRLRRRTPRRFATTDSLSATNAFAGGLGKCGGVPDPVKFGPQRQSDIVRPRSLFVFLDEHPDSLDFVSFWVEDRKSGAGLTSASGSCPGSLHHGAATLSFADGHVELHKWLDPRTKPPVMYSQRLAFSFGSSDNPDIRWLQERTQFEP